MRVNIEFLVISYLVCQAVDWIFQWDWQAANKSKWSRSDKKLRSIAALASHSLTYALCSTALIWIIIPTLSRDSLILQAGVLLGSHLLIDSRIPVIWTMKFKGLKSWQIYDYTNFGFMHIGIDHRFHELKLLILACFIH